jgi:hypothetical protein
MNHIDIDSIIKLCDEYAGKKLRYGYHSDFAGPARQALPAAIEQALEALLAKAQPAPVQSAERGEPEYHCCPHTSDCAVHNMPAYPAGPCDCGYSSTFNLPPSPVIYEVCSKLVERELDRLTNENFGRTPNDTWSNKVVNVYHFFDSNPKAKKLTEIYTTPPAQPAAWIGLEKADMPDGDNPMYDHDTFIAGMIWADAKLREKNGGAA